MPLLSESAFAQLLAVPMERAPLDDVPPVDFWPYVASIAPADFQGVDCSAGTVTYVYRHPDGRHEHVLLDSDRRDLFMVVVLDRVARTVVGHHLLDLPRLYDGEAASASSRENGDGRPLRSAKLKSGGPPAPTGDPKPASVITRLWRTLLAGEPPGGS